jgi:serine/threonine protein kinase
MPAAPPLVLKFADSAEGRRLLRYEARVLDWLRSRGCGSGINYATATYCDPRTDTPALAFPWVEGDTLQDILEVRHRVGRIPAAPMVVAFLTRFAEILAEVHRALYVHRDIKPSNLLICRRPGARLDDLFLIDFGIGGPAGHYSLDEWDLSSDTRRVIDQVLANGHSRIYASPQQRNGELCHPDDDVYAMGVVAIQSLTGKFHLRVDEYDWRSILAGQGAETWFIKLLGCCVSPHPNPRPVNGEELYDRLKSRSGEY